MTLNLKVAVLACMAVASSASAQTDLSPQCPASNILGTGMLSSICWSCIFPIQVAGIKMFGSVQSGSGKNSAGFALSSRPEVPADASNQAACVCLSGPTPHIGINIGMWLPTTLYEDTLIPGCSSFLGGTVIGIADPLYLGTSGNPTEDLEQQTFNHIHTYSFPIVLLMELFTKCNRTFSDIDMLYMSEIDPTWNDSLVALYGNPMSVFGSSIAASAACAADAISSSVGHPIDNLFWCGGTWTSTLTPFTGFQHSQGPVQYTSSSNLRLLAMNHVRGFERRTVGSSALCEAKYDATLNRSHYRWSTAWPRAEATRNHGSGESLLRWGAGKTIPGFAELPIYLQWKWVDCCAPLIGQ